MTSTSTQSSSSSGSIGSGQSSTMASIPSYQMLNHTCLISLMEPLSVEERFESRSDQSSFCCLEETRSNNPQLDLLVAHTRYHGTDHRP
ncbi:hypothetical protein CK203_059549 [Vitis vinifera]|uniref:Uncharacterized protein n=1 Tax=Vitis vinifera TaxID=29760 RepID=A0A438FRK7_VITVI|nr:hypothetical protein CK203_059549 [Vitis vinifera]